MACGRAAQLTRCSLGCASLWSQFGPSEQPRFAAFERSAVVAAVVVAAVAAAAVAAAVVQV